MACRTPAIENTTDTPATILINKKIVEVKKKILLCEAQKKSYVGEWTQREKLNSNSIADLKKEIKELTGKLTILNNVDTRTKYTKEPQEVIKKTTYPAGAKSVADAIKISDLQLINVTKQLDLLNEKYSKRKTFFDTLLEQYQELLAEKSSENRESATPLEQQQHPPATVEEDENRKKITHLENEIHRTNVQWMEAEHVRKKYFSIKASLMADSEKFEKSLLELERAITEQQADLNRIQEINREALQMRDATKIVLLRQEHAAHTSTKSRDRQAFDFRRQVEERKVELERLERKLFSTGKTLLHQGSVESLSGGDQSSSSKKLVKQDSNALAQEMTTEMEQHFKKLMETTGSTSPQEVLERYLSQKESTSRLNYLRTVTEGEKKHLEMQRETLTAQLETTKFSDVKETEENQEQLEKLKQCILAEMNLAEECCQATKHTNTVIDSIKTTLLDLILKLQEVDDALDITATATTKHNREDPFELGDLMNGNITNELMLETLEDKIRKGLIASGQMIITTSSVNEEKPLSIGSGSADDEILTPIKLEELQVPLSISTPQTPTPPRPISVMDERERPQAYPSCYNNLMGARTSGHLSSSSPGQANQQAVATDEEGDVPTRNYLKRQAQYIVDSKSRRKGFRAAPKR